MRKKSGEKDELKRANTMDKTVEEGKLFVEEFERLAKRKEREEKKKDSPNKRQKRSNSPNNSPKQRSKSPKKQNKIKTNLPREESPKLITKRIRKSPLRIKTTQVENALTKGLDLYARRNYKGAIESIQLYLQDNPNDIEALEKLGKSFSILYRHEEAIEQFNKILIIDPQNHTIHYWIGFDFDELHRNGEAIESYKLAIKYAPVCFPDYYFNLAISQMFNKQPREAIENLNIVKEKEDKRDINFNTALCHIYLREFEEAQKHLDLSAKGKESQIIFLVQLLLWSRQKEFELAKELIKKLDLILMKELNAFTQNFLAYVFYKLGEYTSAIEYFPLLLKSTHGGIYREVVLFYYARSLLKSSVVIENINNYDNTENKEKGEMENRDKEVENDQTSGTKENKEVEEKLNECITINPNWSKPFYRRAQYYLSLENKLGAKEDFQKAIEVNEHPRTLPCDRLSPQKIIIIQEMIDSM